MEVKLDQSIQALAQEVHAEPRDAQVQGGWYTMAGQKKQELLLLSDNTLVSNLDGKMYPAGSEVLPDGTIKCGAVDMMSAMMQMAGVNAHKGNTILTQDQVFGLGPNTTTNIKAGPGQTELDPTDKKEGATKAEQQLLTNQSALLGDYVVKPPPPVLPDRVKFLHKLSISKIDFYPSDMKSTWGELHGLLNDWKTYNPDEVIINVENLEVLWPETPMYGWFHPGPRGQTTFRVMCLRVWIQTTGLPRYEQRFAGGDLASPEVFTSRMIPKPIVGTSSAGAFTTAAEVHIDRVHAWAILMILVMSVYVMMVKFE